MFIRPVSDLHIEFCQDYKSHVNNMCGDWNTDTFIPKLPNDKETILLIAGDTIPMKLLDKVYPFYEELSKRFLYVIEVFGNHSHYGSNFLKSKKVMNDFLEKWPNIKLLDNEKSIHDDDVLFTGSTLWTDMNKSDPNTMYYAQMGMNDFRAIKLVKEDGTYLGKWSPEFSVKEHKKCLKAIIKDLQYAKKNDLKSVVVSHHAPSSESICSGFQGSNINGAYYSDLSEIILEYQPNFWFHGHMHSSFDYYIGKTRIVCNPYGYHNHSTNFKYNPKLVLEV